MKCIHYGRHTLYCRLDDADPGLPPEGCKYVAEELGRWGIRVEVDGREACPHFCPVPRDFKIGMWATKLRFKKDLDWSTVCECRIRAMRGDQELTVCDKGGEGRVQDFYDPEARNVPPDPWDEDAKELKQFRAKIAQGKKRMKPSSAARP